MDTTPAAPPQLPLRLAPVPVLPRPPGRPPPPWCAQNSAIYALGSRHFRLVAEIYTGMYCTKCLHEFEEVLSACVFLQNQAMYKLRKRAYDAVNMILRRLTWLQHKLAGVLRLQGSCTVFLGSCGKQRAPLFYSAYKTFIEFPIWDYVGMDQILVENITDWILEPWGVVNTGRARAV